MAEPVLVIDLGTTSTSGALVVGKQVELLREAASTRLDWPSSVLADRGELVVGYVVEDRKSAHPASYQSEVKRLLGRKEPIKLDGEPYRPDQLVSAVLAAVRREAEAVHGGSVSHAVLTVPASYAVGDPRSDLTIRAAEEAGCKIVELLPEPVAASLSEPAGAPFSPGDLVLVYDFGGGTFDVTLVRVGKTGNEVVASGGLEDCGGYDLDVHVADYLADRDEDVAKLFREVGRLGARLEVLDVARSLKHQLSTRQDSVKILPSTGHEVSLGRPELEQIAGGLIERTIECCRALIASAEYSPDDLDAVFLVGGSSHIPLVSDMLEQALGMRPRTARDPVLAVVRGAARWASRGESRAVKPVPVGSDEEPLRWEIPGGVGTMLDWHVEEGAAFPASTVLAMIRLPNGQLLRLTGAQNSVLRARHALPGARVESGAWLATIQRTFPGWATQRLNVHGNTSIVVASWDGKLYIAARHRCWAFDLATGARLWSADVVSDRYELQTMSVAGGAVRLEYKTPSWGTSESMLDARSGREL